MPSISSCVQIGLVLLMSCRKYLSNAIGNASFSLLPIKPRINLPSLPSTAAKAVLMLKNTNPTVLIAALLGLHHLCIGWAARKRVESRNRKHDAVS